MLSRVTEMNLILPPMRSLMRRPACWADKVLSKYCCNSLICELANQSGLAMCKDWSKMLRVNRAIAFPATTGYCSQNVWMQTWERCEKGKESGPTTLEPSEGCWYLATTPKPVVRLISFWSTISSGSLKCGWTNNTGRNVKTLDPTYWEVVSAGPLLGQQAKCRLLFWESLMGILANESLKKVSWNEYVIFEVSRWRETKCRCGEVTSFQFTAALVEPSW